MSQLDFTPGSAAAPAFRQVLSHARTEFGLIIRNGEQLLLALVIPVAVLIAGVFIPDRLGQPAAVTALSVLGLVIWSMAFTSLAITTGFERRYNVLERLAATPLGRTRLILGKAFAFSAITLLLISALGALSFSFLRFGFNPAHLAIAMVSALLAMLTFAGLGLTLAGTAKAEITLGVANLVHLAGMLGGALLIPLSRYPGWAQPIVAVLPTAALGEALRSGAWWAPLSLLAWAAAAVLLARKVFRWTS